MDPFSITAGALGITEFTLSSIGYLHGLIKGLDEAEDVIQDVTSDLEAIQLPLAALENLQISDSTTYVAAKEDLKKTGVTEAVNKCGQACADFSKMLKQWTRHSSTMKLSLRDRLSVGLWNKERVRTFRTQVRSCRAIVQFAIESAQLVILVRSENMSKTARQEMANQLRILETAIQEHIALTNGKRDEALQRKKELESVGDENEDEDGGAQRTLAIRETEEQSRLLEADQTSCGVVSQLLLRLSPSQAGNSYSVVFSGSHNTGIQIGHSAGTINWGDSRT
ncbi:Cytochrome P450 [Penicillium chrysogenum]|uniref:Cytochrome P450 n=1 Tax=Penicillium chrysogenum TaxID=5076 RepID=UPI002399DA5D|nr:Cytochrome P450 [Penicillium chrysogenum]KAJ5237918.1 Cytochrome P450 [Penicillium chrysogenum]KAJ5278221.1 Cytochrome P450 [Penicillium chrysogenum]